MQRWKCPKCGSHNLKVVVLVWAKLFQSPYEDNFQTEPEGGDHEWDEDSRMMCSGCGHDDKAWKFAKAAEKALADADKNAVCDHCGGRNTKELDEDDNECYDCGKTYPRRK